jgi:DNA-binding response OmpR family regulator
MEKVIIVVTGNSDFRSLLDTYLSRSFQVIMTESALHAYILLENGYIPELVITEFDMRLPDGKRLIIKLKESKNYVHIPILVISGSDRAIAKLDLIRTSTTGHIVKPFSLIDLEARVKSLLKIAV